MRNRRDVERERHWNRRGMKREAKMEWDKEVKWKRESGIM